MVEFWGCGRYAWEMWEGDANWKIAMRQSALGVTDSKAEGVVGCIDFGGLQRN